MQSRNSVKQVEYYKILTELTNGKFSSADIVGSDKETQSEKQTSGWKKSMMTITCVGYS